MRTQKFTFVAVFLVMAAAGRVVADPACQAEMTTGVEATAFHKVRACVTKDGTILNMHRHPPAYTLVEGYKVCAQGVAASYHDIGIGWEGGLGAPTVVAQPTPSSFPLTLSRLSNDGKLELIQKFELNGKSGPALRVTMTVKNLESAAKFAVYRIFNVNYSGKALIGFTNESIYSWVDQGVPGLVLSILHPVGLAVDTTSFKFKKHNQMATCSDDDGTTLAPSHQAIQAAAQMRRELGTIGTGSTAGAIFEYRIF